MTTMTFTDPQAGRSTVIVGTHHERVLHYDGRIVSGTVEKAYMIGSVGMTRFLMDSGELTFVPACRVRDR